MTETEGKTEQWQPPQVAPVVLLQGPECMQQEKQPGRNLQVTEEELQEIQTQFASEKQLHVHL